jgi:hypothetical protein
VGRIVVYELGFYLELFFNSLVLVGRTQVCFGVVVLVVALVYVGFTFVVSILLPHTALLIVLVLLLILGFAVLSLSAHFYVLEVLVTLLNQILNFLQPLHLHFLVHSDILRKKLQVVVLLVQLVLLNRSLRHRGLVY